MKRVAEFTGTSPSKEDEWTVREQLDLFGGDGAETGAVTFASMDDFLARRKVMLPVVALPSCLAGHAGANIGKSAHTIRHAPQVCSPCTFIRHRFIRHTFICHRSI